MGFNAVPHWISGGEPVEEIGDTYTTPESAVWVCYYAGDKTISLDGSFSASELRELIAMMEASAA